ncbi:MAG: AMP-binding protein, partial [Anaerovoracaceae bacterium]
MNKKRYKDARYEVRSIKDLRELIQSSAQLFGNRGAFLVKDSLGGEYRPISYIQMLNDMNGLGSSLLDRGFKGQKVAVIAENRYEWVLSYFAVCCGTGILVPIERELTSEDVKNLLVRSGATAVIYSSKTEHLIEEAISEADTGIRKIHMDLPDHQEATWSLDKLIEEGRSLMEAGNSDYLNAPIDTEAMSLLLFTSGTTGTAKGVMLSHKNLVSNVMNMSMYVNVNGFVGLSVLPMHHTYEMTCHILTSIYQGCTVAICEGLKYITKNMIEAKVSVMLGVPLIFEAMHKRIWKQARKSERDRKMSRAIALSKKLRLYNTGLPHRMFRQVHDAIGGEMKLLISGAAAMDPEMIEN